MLTQRFHDSASAKPWKPNVYHRNQEPEKALQPKFFANKTQITNEALRLKPPPPPSPLHFRVLQPQRTSRSLGSISGLALAFRRIRRCVGPSASLNVYLTLLESALQCTKMCWRSAALPTQCANRKGPSPHLRSRLQSGLPEPKPTVL